MRNWLHVERLEFAVLGLAGGVQAGVPRDRVSGDLAGARFGDVNDAVGVLKVGRAARHVGRAGDHQVTRVAAGAAEIGRDVAREKRIELAGLRIDHGRPHVAGEKIEEVQRFDAVIDQAGRDGELVDAVRRRGVQRHARPEAFDVQTDDEAQRRCRVRRRRADF